jgi:uncharacterized membrane protein
VRVISVLMNTDWVMVDRCLEISGGFVCHQIPERSFVVDGHPLPLCARCTGLYLGTALGGLLGLWRAFLSRGSLVQGTPAIWVWLGVVGLVVHASGEHWGFWAASNLERAAAGALGGLALGWALVSLLLLRPMSEMVHRGSRLRLRRLVVVVVTAAAIVFHLWGFYEGLAAVVGVSLFATYFLLNLALVRTVLSREKALNSPGGWLTPILNALLLWCGEWVALDWLL